MLVRNSQLSHFAVKSDSLSYQKRLTLAPDDRTQVDLLIES